MSGRQRPQLATWLSLAALLLAVALAFSDVLGPSRGLFFRDHVAVFKPLWWSSVRQVLSGEWPALNIGNEGALPTELSVGSAFWTPASLIFLFGSFDSAYDLFVAFHVALTAVGSFLLARRLGAGHAAAIAAGAVAGLSGPVLSFENLLVGLQGIAWTPWIGLALIALAHKPGPGAVAGLATSLGCQAQAIMPELLVLDLFLGAGLLLYLRPKLDRRHAIALTASALLAFGISAIDLLPQLEGLRNSQRLAGFDAATRAGWSLTPPLQLIEWIAPAFWAPPDLLFVNAPTITGSPADPPYLLSLYWGLALPLALAAPFRERRAQVLAAVFVFALLMALGSHTPVFRLISALPVLRNGRYAIKYLLLSTAALAALAALSLGQLERTAKRVLVLSLLQAALLGIGLRLLAMPEVAAAIMGWIAPTKSVRPFEVYASPDLPQIVIQAMTQRVWHGVVFAVLGAVLAGWAVRRTDKIAWSSAALAAALALDLGLAGGRFSVVGADVARQRLPSQVIEQLGGKGARVHVLAPPTVPNTPGVSYFESYVIDEGLHGLHAWDSLRRLFGADLDAQSTSLQGLVYNSLAERDDADYSHLLGRAGVEQVIDARARPDLEPSLSWSDALGRPIHAYPTPWHRPPVQAWTRWRSTPPEPTALIDRLARTSTSVGVLHGEPVPEPNAGPCLAQARVEPPIRSERWSLHVSAACPVLVVVPTPYWPRWRAQVDGEPTTTRAVDAGDLGAFVPAGEHELHFVYDSASAQYGPAALVSWLIVAALALVAWRRLAQ